MPAAHPLAWNLLSWCSTAPCFDPLPEKTAMNNKTSQILYAYWNDVRGKRIAPRRFEIEPARLGNILPETFILECNEPGSYRFRLAGTRIIETFGAEFRGTDFLELWDDADRNLLAAQLTTLTSQGGVGALTFDAAAPDGRRVAFEALLLPLVHTANVIDRVVGCISCAAPPDWLGAARLADRHLIAHETIWPDGRPHAVLARGALQAPFLAHTREARLVRSERRQFRVYTGGLAKADGDDL
jgi:hypothetical protein